MSTAYTPHDLYLQMTTGALGTALAADVTADNTAAIAAILNATTGAFAGTVARSPISAADFLAAVNASELETLTAGQKLELQIETETGVVNIGSPSIQAWVNQTFPSSAAPITNAALIALATRPASFVEARYGSAFANGITTDQIEAALEGH